MLLGQERDVCPVAFVLRIVSGTLVLRRLDQCTVQVAKTEIQLTLSCRSSMTNTCCQATLSWPRFLQKLSRRQQELYPWIHTELGISCHRQPVFRTNRIPLRSSLFGMTHFVLPTGSGSCAACQSYCGCETKNVACPMGYPPVLATLGYPTSSISSRSGDMKWVH
jgi:hypothetical protein